MTAPTKGLAALRALGEWAQELLEQGQTRAAAMVAEMVAEGVGIMEGRADSLTVKRATVKLSNVEHSEKTRSDLSKRFGRKKDPNMDAAREAGIPSLRALAAKLGCSASFLSQVAAKDRPMPADKATAFKKLTGKDWQ